MTVLDAPLPLHAPAVDLVDERLARADLRRQIARLERRLVALAPVAAPTPRSRGGARVLDLAGLERTRDELVERIAAASAAAAERAEEIAGHRARLEAMLADPRAHRFERVRRADLGLSGCGAYHVRPRVGLVGMLAGWWEVKLSSGCP